LAGVLRLGTGFALSVVEWQKAKSKGKGKKMKVKPKEAYELAGIPSTKLDPERVYDAVEATNQPDYKEQGLVFVGEILLDKTEYTEVS
jgi:hypothetical protein